MKKLILLLLLLAASGVNSGAFGQNKSFPTVQTLKYWTNNCKYSIVHRGLRVCFKIACEKDFVFGSYVRKGNRPVTFGCKILRYHGKKTPSPFGGRNSAS
ncbi:MAG: hypothetical protein ACK4Q5_13760 [Saprospiraceae bacterium]